MRPDWDRYFMGIAYAVSARASCPRRKVGCVLTRDGYLLSVGYNGAPRGVKDCLETGCLMINESCQRSVHAEMNALIAAAHTGTSIKGATAFVTTKPCYSCARSMVNAGIQAVWYTEDYHTEWPDRLPITLIQLKDYNVPSNP